MVALAIIGALVSVIYRGPEFDEFWTITISDPRAPLDWQFTNMWMRDAHPPLFAFGSRLAQAVVGDNYVALRFFNLVPLCAFLGLFGACWAWAPRARAFLLCFLLLWVSSLFFGWYFAEARSYFAQHAFVAVFMTGAVVALAYPPASRQQLKLLAAFSMAGLFFAANLYFLTAAISAPFLGLFVLFALIQHRPRLALAFFGGGVIAYAPLIVTTLIQAEFMLRYASGSNWVEAQTIGEALGEFFRSMWRSAGQNLPVILVALGCGAAAVIAVVRSPGRKNQGDGAGLIALSMLAVWFGASAVLLAIDQMKPFIVGQYLLALGAALNTVIALAIARPMFRWPALYWLSFVFATGVTGAGLVQKSLEPNWGGTIRAIETALKTCKDAPVWFAMWPREKRPELEEGIFPIAYRHAAKVGGFQSNAAPLADRSLPPIAPGCGEYVWVEHMPSRDLLELSAEQILRAVGPSLAVREEVEFLARTDTGVVLKIAPAASP